MGFLLSSTTLYTVPLVHEVGVLLLFFLLYPLSFSCCFSAFCSVIIVVALMFAFSSTTCLQFAMVAANV